MKKNDQYQPRILTPSQYEALKKKAEVISVQLLEGKNFEEILVFDTVLNFRK